MNLEAHKLADLFPLMEGADFDALREDIKDNGLIEPIVTLEGKILDGRNRYRACQEAGVAVRTIMFDPAHGDPLQWVISKNLKRRHVDESQRSYVASKIETLKHGGDRKSDQDANWQVDRATASKMLRVSERSIARAAVVRDKATPELQAAVEQGHIAVSVAATAAALPIETQIEIAAKAKAGDANAVRTVVKQKARAEKERVLGAKQQALPPNQYGVILADPEWAYKVRSEKGKDRSAENHYPVSDTDQIKARAVPSIAADDCVLWLWATVPMLPAALEVMKAWGFEYKTHFVWIKDRIGTGYWNRNRHELLLLGTKGNIPAPAPGTQWDSVIEAPVGRHSEKPEKALELIETYFPTLRKIELNRRGEPRPGWDAWGNEVEACTPDAAASEAPVTTATAERPVRLSSGTSAAAIAARSKTSYQKLEGQLEMPLDRMKAEPEVSPPVPVTKTITADDYSHLDIPGFLQRQGDAHGARDEQGS
jgi:N6-adenosine-specific RNA methylase IME4